MQNTKSKKLLSGILIYGIGTFGTKILSFLIVPLYTYYISTSEMGTYDLLHSTMGVLTPIITLQISDAAYRWMIRKENVHESIQSTLQVLLCNCLVFSALILLVNSFYRIPYCYYYIGTLMTSRALQTIQKLLRGLSNQKLYTVSSIIYSIIYLTLNVIQICALKMGVVALFQSAIIANIFTVTLIFIAEKRLRFNIFYKIDIRFIKELLSVSTPLVPNQLNWWVMSSSDRYVISWFLGNSANGIYAISYKFPSLLHVVLSLFSTSWQDVSIADDKKDERFYTAVFEKLYTFSFTMMPALIAITQLYIRGFMAESYHDSSKYIAFLYLGTVFQVFASFYGVGYIREKKTKNATLTSVLGAIVNFIVNILLIESIGLFAAEISTFLGFFCMWYVRVLHNKKQLGITINKKKFISLLSLTIIICSVSSWFNTAMDLLILVLGAMYFIIFNISEIKKVIGSIVKKNKHHSR